MGSSKKSSVGTGGFEMPRRRPSRDEELAVGCAWKEARPQTGAGQTRLGVHWPWELAVGSRG